MNADTVAKPEDDRVSVMIYDLTEVEHPGLEPGFYYDIPVDDDAFIAEVRLEGPYPTREAALDAAQAFISDAMTDHTAEVQENAA